MPAALSIHSHGSVCACGWNARNFSTPRLRVSPEGREGLSAFFDKRKPDWIPQG